MRYLLMYPHWSVVTIQSVNSVIVCMSIYLWYFFLNCNMNGNISFSSTSPVIQLLNCVRMNCVRMNCVGMNCVGMSCVGMSCAGMNCAGMNCAGMNCV